MGRVSSSSGIWVLAAPEAEHGHCQRNRGHGQERARQPSPFDRDAQPAQGISVPGGCLALQPVPIPTLLPRSCPGSFSNPLPYPHSAAPFSAPYSQSVPTHLLVQGSPWCPAPSHPHCCVVSDPALPACRHGWLRVLLGPSLTPGGLGSSWSAAESALPWRGG